MTRDGRAVQFRNPVTGKVLTLAASTEELAEYLDDVREYAKVLQQHNLMVTRELAHRPPAA